MASPRYLAGDTPATGGLNELSGDSQQVPAGVQQKAGLHHPG